MKMRLVCIICAWFICEIKSEIRDGGLLNKLIKVKPVGGHVAKNFVPLTELPVPRTQHFHKVGRRHFEGKYSQGAAPKEVIEGSKVALISDYNDEGIAKTVATVIIPDHVDRKHFEVTTQVPYLTVGPIEGIGFHPTTDKLSKCEKIYQDHINEQYTEEDTDYSEESLEKARLPVFTHEIPVHINDQLKNLYSDFYM